MSLADGTYTTRSRPSSGECRAGCLWDKGHPGAFCAVAEPEEGNHHMNDATCTDCLEGYDTTVTRHVCRVANGRLCPHGVEEVQGGIFPCWHCLVPEGSTFHSQHNPADIAPSPRTDRIAFLERKREATKADLLLKFEDGDYHGVADAAMDLRDIESELDGLRFK